MSSTLARDTRSTEIKRLLQRTYPAATFRVSIHKYSMGESINVKTSLFTHEGYGDDIYNLDCRMNRGETLSDTEYQRWQQHRQQLQVNSELTKAIERLLKNYWSIDYDSATGEILGGGNTYLNVGAISQEPRR